MTELPDLDGLLGDDPQRHELDQPLAHEYLSTACWHAINDGDEQMHTACRNVCKYCPGSCGCSCHGEVGTQPGRTAPVDQARDIARELLAAIVEFDRRKIITAEAWERIQSDPALFWLRGEEKPPGVWTPPEVSDDR